MRRASQSRASCLRPIFARNQARQVLVRRSNPRAAARALLLSPHLQRPAPAPSRPCGCSSVLQHRHARPSWATRDDLLTPLAVSSGFMPQARAQMTQPPSSLTWPQGLSAAGVCGRRPCSQTALPARRPALCQHHLLVDPHRGSNIKVTASPHMVAGRAFSRRYRTPPSPWMRDYIIRAPPRATSQSTKTLSRQNSLGIWHH